ncbi:L-lactate dehydrogenase-like [Onthophagus taurus]|uniref:L-lactate dehydrogenase-like n=1 Tax=Onthophagus taurus TaxID=166361 RepID=UPI000C20D72E|nr:L-lactate dehydrogenase-like [Onthophagus taurus]
MKRRVFSLARRFIRALLKDSVIQNLKNDPGQQAASFSTMPIRFTNLSNTLMTTELKDVSYGNAQKLVIPSTPLFHKPTLSYFQNRNNLKNMNLSKNDINKPSSLNFSNQGGGLKDCLLKKIQDKDCKSKKVTVVGAGSVGIACAYTILAQKVSNHICLIDAMKNKLEGEALDIQHGSTFSSNLHVEHSTEYSISEGSKVCIVTAGARQKEGESRLSLMGRNVAIMKAVIPNLVKHSPDTVILIASNPVDIMTFLSWKLSGLPKGRVVGAGTNLDSARFRYYIAQRLGIAPGSCHGWIIGEHGDSSVALWSGVNVAGVRLVDLNPRIGQKDDPERWSEVHRLVISSAGDVIKLKGYTSWAIGMSVAALTSAILGNLGSVHAVSVPVQGFHDIQEDVYLSLPASLGSNGVNDIVIQNLAEEEKCEVVKSAQLLHTVQKDIKM